MLWAIIAGESDPERLADLAHRKTQAARARHSTCTNSGLISFRKRRRNAVIVS
jgi:hypothetical protein